MSGINDDPLVSVLPIHYSTALAPNIQMHQFPLLTRPLQVPPSAAQSGKKIRARIKPNAARIEVHVPVDTRPEVWNAERSRELGQARAEDDQEKSLEAKKGKQKEGDEHRLSEIRLRSERIPERGVYMLGIMRDGRLHLHPINQTHQLRPALTYMDAISRKSNRRVRAGDASDSESDNGPPQDPDDPQPSSPPKKEKKTAGEAKEVHVAVKKTDDKGSQSLQGGLSGVRREMLLMIRDEDEEKWENIEYCDGETEESTNAFEAVFSKSEQQLESKTSLIDILKDIQGL